MVSFRENFQNEHLFSFTQILFMEINKIGLSAMYVSESKLRFVGLMYICCFTSVDFLLHQTLIGTEAFL